MAYDCPDSDSDAQAEWLAVNVAVNEAETAQELRPSPVSPVILEVQQIRVEQ